MGKDARTRLWIVRHGATKWSELGQHTSVTDLPLLPQGQVDAERVGERLADYEFGLVLTSPRRRARDTAALAGFPTAEVDEDLVEWSYGPGEGLTSDQIRAQVPGWRIWTHGAPAMERDEEFPPGEVVDDVAARLSRVVERVRGCGHERALAFGHGHALRALAMVWLGMPVSEAAHFPLATAAVSVLGYEKESPALEMWNSR